MTLCEKKGQAQHFATVALALLITVFLEKVYCPISIKKGSNVLWLRPCLLTGCSILPRCRLQALWIRSVYSMVT
jgi:hypothetical protein